MSTPLPPSAFEEVALTWAEPAPPRQPTPTENPPEYETAQLPTETITYSFSPSSLNSMILVPSPHAQDTRPRYHITVNVNCFMPLSHITTVRRGANEFGEFVGDFEMGIIDRADSICIRGNELPLSSVVNKDGSRRTASWIWSPNGRAANRRAVLVWSAATNPYTCRLTAPGSTIIANFYPVVAMRKRNEPAPLAQLEVFPSGQKHFDDILLSLLVIERKRLTPSSADFSHLFSR